MERFDVLVVGGGVAGLSASIFTARAGLDTVVVNDGEPILRRNAHLENYPGFPQGVDARMLLAMMEEQAEGAGVTVHEGRVVDVDHGDDDGFDVALDDDEGLWARRVVAASWSDVSYLDGLGAATEQRGSKRFVQVDHAGRTGVDGLYAAGRVADQYHQAVVAAGHGATVGITVVHESDVPFYHDWVTPEGYFTGRGREVPPGCEEVDDDERLEREAEARERVRTWMESPLDDRPTQHPSVTED